MIVHNVFVSDLYFLTRYGMLGLRSLSWRIKGDVF